MDKCKGDRVVRQGHDITKVRSPKCQHSYPLQIVHPTGGVDVVRDFNADAGRTDVDLTPPPSSSYTKSQTLVCNGEVRTNSDPVVHPHLGEGRGDDGGGARKTGERRGTEIELATKVVLKADVA